MTSGRRQQHTPKNKTHYWHHFSNVFLLFTRTWLWKIRLTSVTFVRPSQGMETFGNNTRCTLAILWPPCKIYVDRPRRTLPSGASNGKGVANTAMLRSGISSPDEFLVYFAVCCCRSPDAMACEIDWVD